MLQVMAGFPHHSIPEFFSDDDGIYSPPNLSQFMKRKRFWDLSHCMTFASDEHRPFLPRAPSSFDENDNDELTGDGIEEATDQFWKVRPMIEAFNRNTNNAFSPGWLTCLDESMVQWTNEKAPGFMYVGRKPTNNGNEYHTIACAETKILFGVELVEGKDEPDFRKKEKGTAALLTRLTKPIWHSNRVVCLDSGFGVVDAALTLLAKGLYATTVYKKRRYFPRNIPGDSVAVYLDNAPIGTVATKLGVRNETRDVNPQIVGREFRLFAIREEAYVSLFTATWGGIEREGKLNFRRLKDKTIVQFKYPKIVTEYYRGRHAVDDNNNLRQGSQNMEHSFKTKRWILRQFTFIFNLAEVNALIAMKKFGDVEHTLPLFRRKLSLKLLNKTTSMKLEQTLAFPRDQNGPQKSSTVL
eukprot:m.133075 g.133075  ORF g.133075 m.133075 type:complete len:412 (+) comp9491_c0_seq2:1076-2311(+)